MSANSKKSILIVEDDKVSSLLIKDLLEKAGYIVTSVNSGEEAVEKVVKEDFTPNLILMDIDLGSGIDGTQAAKEILKKKHIPVVFHTSHTEKEYVDKIKEITRYGYVVKNSGDFVLKASIDTAFELFEANQIIQKQRDELERSYEEAQAANDELISIQEKLMQSEIRYKELFSNIKSGVAIYKANPDGSDFEFIDFNKAAEKMDGDKRSDLLGKFLSEARPGVIEFGLIEVLKRVWLTGISEYLPMKVYKDGKISGYYDNYVYRLPSGEIVAVFDNFTDLRIAKERAEENEEKFRFLFENMIQGVVYHNARGEIVEANKSSCEILGLSLEQMFGLTSFDPRWRAIRENGDEYKGEEHPSSITLKTGKAVLNAKMGVFNPKENKYRWININSIPKFRKNEIKPYQVIVTFEDITKLKEQQDELTISKTKTEESEIRFKALHNASFGGIVIHDKGVILDCNMGLSKLTGYEYDELIGMDGLRLIAEESKELVLSNIYAGYEKPYEALGIRKNGEKYPIRLEGKNIPYKNKIVRVTEFRDITEIKKAEKNLNETRELLTLFIKNSPIYTYIKKVTSEESRVVFASQNFIDMIGILGSDMTGKNMSELFPREFADKITKDDQIVVSKGEMLTLDEELGGKSYFAIKFPILLNGENFLAGYTIDITDRKNAEKIIQEQLKEKEILLKEVYHRIKNNINSIKSLLSLQAGAIENEEAKKILNDAIARVQSVNIIYDKLLLSNVYKETSVKSYLKDLINAIVDIFPNKEKIIVEDDIEDFELDVKRLFSIGIIVNEVVTNSMKYAFKKIEQGIIKVKLSKNDKKITLLISDNGEGIPEGFDIDNAKSLGLMLVKMLAIQLDASFKIKNENGACFIFQFLL